MVWALKKKGNVIMDSLTILILIFAFSVLGVVGYYIFGEFNTDIQTDADLSDTAKDTSSSLYDRYPSFMDGLFVFFFMLVWGAAIVASFLIDAHPIFFLFMIIALVFVLFVGAEISNTYDELSTDENFDYDSFPMTQFIMTHLIEFVIAIASTVGLVLYGKNRFLQR